MLLPHLAVGEGAEEVTVALVDPAAKSIYKGKDAFAEYGSGEYWKGVGKAGLAGAAVSSVYGGAFDVMAGGVKTGDVKALLEDANATETKGINLQTIGKLDGTTREKLNSRTLSDFKQIESILKKLPKDRRAKIIKSYNLDGMFEADGNMNADFSKSLDGDGNLEYNKNYISYTARGSAQKIADTLSDMSADVAQKYAEQNNVDIETAKAQVGEFQLYNQELSENGNKTFTKFKKALSYLNKLGDSNVKFAVVEPNSSFNGALKDGVLYIGADTFENGKWAGTLVHEYMHFEEGTAEYDTLVKHLESDNALLGSALASVSGKAYGFDGTKLDAIIEKASSGEGITADERRYYASFKGEVSAHMGEMLLGSETFIDAIVAKDGNIAQKTVAKIKSLKAMFERLGNAEANAEYKFLKKAEDLYLKAAEKAGDARLIRYISSGEWDEVEIDIESESLYSGDLFSLKDAMAQDVEERERKMREVMERFGLAEDEAWAVIKYKTAEAYKINAKLREGMLLNATQEKIVRLLDSALEKLPKHKGKVYRTVSFDDLFNSEEEYNIFLKEHSEGNFVAYNAYTSTSAKTDGHPMPDDTKYGATLEIECENGRDIDGFGNNFENEILYPRCFSFVVTEVSTDSNGIPYIKVKEIGEDVRHQRNSEERSNILQQVRVESSVYGDLQEVSEQNTLRSGSTENSVQGVQTEKRQIAPLGKFSLKESFGTTKEYKQYSQKEVKGLVGDMLANELMFEKGNAVFEKKADIEQEVKKRLDTASVEKSTEKAIEKLADFILKKAHIKGVYAEPTADVVRHQKTVDSFKKYLHTLDLTSVMAELQKRYGERPAAFYRWNSKVGYPDISLEQVKNELAEKGFKVDGNILEPCIQTLDTLRPYLHKLNLDNLKGEIQHHYDKDRSVYSRWSKRKGHCKFYVGC